MNKRRRPSTRKLREQLRWRIYWRRHDLPPNAGGRRRRSLTQAELGAPYYTGAFVGRIERGEGLARRGRLRKIRYTQDFARLRELRPPKPSGNLTLQLKIRRLSPHPNH